MSEETERPDPAPELLRLIELAAKYPEIGPPLAELAFKIGEADLGKRVVRMGLEGGAPGTEYYFVLCNVARRERRWDEGLAAVIDAVKAFAARAEAPPDEGTRLLHLVRAGFSMLLFELKDPAAHPEFVQALCAELPGLEPRLGSDPFFHALLAQALWTTDRERSEAEWERAVALGEAEMTWNARGTWYKDAEKDGGKAEDAYRKGLAQAPQSALLMHNLAQVLVDRAAAAEVDVEQARRLLREADELVRGALREDGPKGLRRHVHGTRDRIFALRQSLPSRGGGRHAEEAQPPEPPREPPAVGEVIKGRVTSLTVYGAFVSLGGGIIGLLHKTEMAHEPVADPARLVKVGDEVEVKVLEVRREGQNKFRVGLSRRALLPAPAQPAIAAAAPSPAQVPPRAAPRRAPREQGASPSGFLAGGKLSIGEIILAKLKEQQEKK